MRPGLTRQINVVTQTEINVSIADFLLQHRRWHNLPYIPDAQLSNDTDDPEKQTFGTDKNVPSNRLKCATFSSEY